MDRRPSNCKQAAACPFLLPRAVAARRRRRKLKLGGHWLEGVSGVSSGWRGGQSITHPTLIGLPYASGSHPGHASSTGAAGDRNMSAESIQTNRLTRILPFPARSSHRITAQGPAKARASQVSCRRGARLGQHTVVFCWAFLLLIGPWSSSAGYVHLCLCRSLCSQRVSGPSEGTARVATGRGSARRWGWIDPSPTPSRFGLTWPPHHPRPPASLRRADDPHAEEALPCCHDDASHPPHRPLSAYYITDTGTGGADPSPSS